MRVYADAINKTSTTWAPWHVIPADDKPMARYLIGKIILERLELFTDIKEPKLNDDDLANLEVYIAELKN